MPNLILIPTQGERQSIESSIDFNPQQWSIHTVGFGVIAAGIETMRLLNLVCPDEVILAGIAGVFQSNAKGPVSIGEAIWANRVFLDGIGVGQGDAFIDAKTLGWSLSGSFAQASEDDSDAISCQTPAWAQSAPILTVCSGSATQQDANRRMEKFPGTVGEEMEGFPVALACHNTNTPISVVRGFSNLVGDRDRSGWKIRQALLSVSEQLQRYIDRSTR